MAGLWLGNDSCRKDIEIIIIANQLWISIIFANKTNMLKFSFKLREALLSFYSSLSRCHFIYTLSTSEYHVLRRVRKHWTKSRGKMRIIRKLTFKIYEIRLKEVGKLCDSSPRYILSFLRAVYGKTSI